MHCAYPTSISHIRVDAFKTTSAVLNFLLFMIMNPGVQRKLQEELDTHIGRSKTPNMNEVLSLPYLRATWKETLRMMPPIPLGE